MSRVGQKCDTICCVYVLSIVQVVPLKLQLAKRLFSFIWLLEDEKPKKLPKDKISE